MIDNTTAVSVINNKGTSHNDQCNGHYARKIVHGTYSSVHDIEWMLNLQFLK